MRDPKVVYHAEIETTEPERWRAWTPQVPGITGYGKTPGEAVDMVAGSERVLAFKGEPQFTVDQLWDAIDRLWGWMGVAEVNDMRQADPDLVGLAIHAHHRMSHEQRSVR